MPGLAAFIFFVLLVGKRIDSDLKNLSHRAVLCMTIYIFSNTFFNNIAV